MSQANSNRFLSIDTLLLLVLAIAHLWFNPVSSALVVTLLAVYVLLGIVSPAMPDEMPAPRARHRYLFLARLLIVFFILAIAALLPTGLNILQRRIEGPATHAHDGLLQTEAAIQFLLAGKNPYTENYLNTPMADFKGAEPPFTTAPLYHNAYLPALFIISIPLYLASQATIGWYDQRFLYLLFYGAVLLLLPRLAARQRDRLSLLSVFGLNFLFTYFLADGRNDIVVLFGLVLVTFLLSRRWSLAAGIVLGITLAVKHSAWFFVPFYFFYLQPPPWTRATVRGLARQALPIVITAALILLPFVLWDAASFFDDTVSYIIGIGATSFPIKGWGFSTLLLVLGVIPSPETAFPFGIFEILFGAPVFLFLLARQRREENTLRQVWFGFAILSFVVQFFSRFFNDNYVVFALQALVIASFIAPTQFKNAAREVKE
ncbi:MAG: hypothetical protein HY327_02165 [Chloroflexi bacterium]|nr:hypothetical protein [Chloroflexota bacterium]